MLTGRNDLDAEIESVFAFPYYQGFQFHRGKTIPQDMQLKRHTQLAISGRLTASTVATIEEFYETDGSKAQETFEVDGSKIVTYSLADDESWATHVWGGASYGGADDPADPPRRFYAFRTYNAVGWFEFRPVITVSGKDQEFHLVAWQIDDQLSPAKIPADLFIPR